MASSSMKYLVYSFILALVMTCISSARILDQEVPVAPVVAQEPDSQDTSIPTITPEAATTGAAATTDVATTTDAATPATTGATATTGAVATIGAVTPTTTGAAATTSGTATTGAAAGAVSGGPGHTLTFFMHDILGGTTPSATAVTGVVNNPAVNGQVPFAKRYGAVLSFNNGVETNDANSGIVSNNNIPFLTGLGGTTPNVFQNNNNGNNNFGNGGAGFSVNGEQLPTGTALQKLMFGTMTVFDDELTEGHELGSGTVGKAQGFYVSSSIDGLSQTMAFTAMFQSGGYIDSLSFFGIHRTPVSESHLAIMGGTGKYVNAKGFAIVKTFPSSNLQHNTDGVETLLETSVYLSYE